MREVDERRARKIASQAREARSVILAKTRCGGAIHKGDDSIGELKVRILVVKTAVVGGSRESVCLVIAARL